MKGLLLICAIWLQLGWSNAKEYSSGVGAFSYQDSSGNRYGGTYGLKDGEVVDAKGSFPPNFSPPTDFSPPIDFSPPTDFSVPFGDPDDFGGFFPEYFRNLENLLQDPGFEHFTRTIPRYIQPTPYFGYGYNEPNFSSFGPVPNFTPHYNYYNRAFQANLDSQKLALDAAHKAFDLTSNQAAVTQNLNPSRLTPFNEFSAYHGAFPNMNNGPQFRRGFPFEGGLPTTGAAGGNSAFAGASAGPGFSQHFAAINPANPYVAKIAPSTGFPLKSNGSYQGIGSIPPVHDDASSKRVENSPNINKVGDGSSGPGFKSVSVSSYSSTSDVNGRKTNSHGAKTMINDNGQISGYSVHSP